MTCLTRIQDPSKQQVPSIDTRLRHIYVQQSVKALFADVIPRTMWISAGGAIFLSVYEWVVHGLMRA